MMAKKRDSAVYPKQLKLPSISAGGAVPRINDQPSALGVVSGAGTDAQSPGPADAVLTSPLQATACSPWFQTPASQETSPVHPTSCLTWSLRTDKEAEKKKKRRSSFRSFVRTLARKLKLKSKPLRNNEVTQTKREPFADEDNPVYEDIDVEDMDHGGRSYHHKVFNAQTQNVPLPMQFAKELTLVPLPQKKGPIAQETQQCSISGKSLQLSSSHSAIDTCQGHSEHNPLRLTKSLSDSCLAERRRYSAETGTRPDTTGGSLESLPWPDDPYPDPCDCKYLNKDEYLDSGELYQDRDHYANKNARYFSNFDYCTLPQHGINKAIETPIYVNSHVRVYSDVTPSAAEDPAYDQPQSLPKSLGVLQSSLENYPLEAIATPPGKVDLESVQKHYRDKLKKLKTNMNKTEFSRFMLSAEEKHSLDFRNPDHVNIHCAVTRTILKVAKWLKRLNPNYRGRIIPTGSYHDKTKLSPPDEQDYIYEIESNDFEMVLHDEHSLTFLVTPLDGSWDDECDPYVDVHALSPRTVSGSFLELVSMALYRIKLPSWIKHGGFCSPQFGGCRRNGPAVTILLLCWTESTGEILVTVDLTPALPVSLERLQQYIPGFASDWPEEIKTFLTEKKPMFHLIPTDGMAWKLSTSHLEVRFLSNLSSNRKVNRTIRQLKILRDLFLSVEGLEGGDRYANETPAILKPMVEDIVEHIQMTCHMERLLENKMIRELLVFYLTCRKMLWLSRCAPCIQTLKNVQDALCDALLSGFSSLDPALQKHTREICKPYVTIKSCVFKYLVLELYFSSNGELRGTDKASEVDIDLLCRLLYSSTKEEIRHPLLKTAIKTKSTSTFAERCIPGVGQRDWKEMHDNLCKDFVELLSSVSGTESIVRTSSIRSSSRKSRKQNKDVPDSATPTCNSPFLQVVRTSTGSDSSLCHSPFDFRLEHPLAGSVKLDFTPNGSQITLPQRTSGDGEDASIFQGETAEKISKATDADKATIKDLELENEKLRRIVALQQDQLQAMLPGPSILVS